MNIPRTIYDEPIANWPSSTWLRATADDEHAADEAPFYVYSRKEGAVVAAPEVVALARRLDLQDPACVLEPDDELLAV